MDLTEQQLAAIEMFKQYDVMVLTGGPGTGKTTTCKAIMEMVKKQGKSIALCAPSGKAAKRLSEATGEVATTIHKLLEARMFGETFMFMRDHKAPLDQNVIICDEVSMVSNDLMARLLEATKAGKKVLFVGDQDQLPSVGAGAVLRDFLASGVIPHVELTIIHRNTGRIVSACHEIKHGRLYSPSPELDLPYENLRHIEAHDPQKIVDIIVQLISENIARRGYNPVWDVQVISPYNERTLMSCENINHVLQEKLNPNKPIVDDRGKQYLFKPGDKAIQTKNEIVRHEHSSDYVVNGDLCEIISIEKRQVLAKFFYPDRTVVLDRVANHLKLAYAITCHKFQGSEAPVVIIPVHSSFAYFVTRPWIYTAISRAQEICITVGQFSAIKKAIEKAHSNKRITKLEEKLRATLRQQPQPGKYNREGRLKRVVKKVPLPAMEPAF